MITLDELFPIGQTHKPHGLKGEVACTFTNTVFDDEAAPYFVLEIDHIPVPFFLEEYRFRTDTSALVKFEGIDTEKAARTVSDKIIYLPLKYCEMSSPDNATLQDLVGFRVVDARAGELGTVAEVDESTLNALFLLDDGRIFPAHDEFVEDVDYAARTLHVNLPDGILSLNE